MKQYFSIDSAIFTFVALGSIIIGSSIWLMIFSVVSITSLILKSKLSVKDSNGKNAIFTLLIATLVLGTVLFWFFGFGLVLFGFWIYILIKYLNR